MQNEFDKILNKMNVNEDRADAEEKAIELYKTGKNALEYLIDQGLKIKTKTMDHKAKTLLRSVIFTISVFYTKNKSIVEKSARYSDIVNLLIDLYFLGFQSAHKLLSKMNFSDFEIYRKKLSDLPTVEKHKQDKEISMHEAFEEIRMSKNYTGSKGFKKDHYSLGHDEKRAYELYRVGKKLFSLRTHRKI